MHFACFWVLRARPFELFQGGREQTTPRPTDRAQAHRLPCGRARSELLELGRSVGTAPDRPTELFGGNLRAPQGGMAAGIASRYKTGPRHVQLTVNGKTVKQTGPMACIGGVWGSTRF